MVALLASRGLGVIRQSLFNDLFGTGLEANAYYAAARLPDTLFDLIAGGALSHAFIPVFLSYEKDKGQREAWRLASLVFNLMLVVLVVVILIGELLTPAFVNNILVPGPGFTPHERAITVGLTRIMLIQPLVLALGTIVTSVLNSKRQFLLPALSIAVYNLGLIGGSLVALAVPGVGIYGPTYGVLVGSALQVGVQLPALFKQGVRYTFLWDLRHSGLGDVVRLLGPNMLALGVVYIGLIIDTAFSSYLPDPSSLAALHNAQMLQGVPYALLSQTIGQALLPHLTVQAAGGRYFRMRQTALKVMGASIVLTVPTAIALAIVGKPLIHLIFQHGAFGAHSTDLTNLALLGYVFALPGLTAADLVSRGYFALKDAHTPLFTNIFSVLTRVGLMALLFRVLPTHLLILTIPLALAGASTAEAGLLTLILLLRLVKRVRTDRGMQRLRRRQQHKMDLRQEEERTNVTTDTSINRL